MLTIYTVSDATGATAERVVQAALVQFEVSDMNIRRLGGVRNTDIVHKIVQEAAMSGGFIVHTFVSEDLRRTMLTEGRALNVTTIDLMGPLLARLSELLELKPLGQPGDYRAFDISCMERIDAIDYTVRHDDGRNMSRGDRIGGCIAHLKDPIKYLPSLPRLESGEYTHHLECRTSHPNVYSTPPKGSRFDRQTGATS